MLISAFRRFCWRPGTTCESFWLSDWELRGILERLTLGFESPGGPSRNAFRVRFSRVPASSVMPCVRAWARAFVRSLALLRLRSHLCTSCVRAFCVAAWDCVPPGARDTQTSAAHATSKRRHLLCTCDSTYSLNKIAWQNCLAKRAAAYFLHCLFAVVLLSSSMASTGAL